MNLWKRLWKQFEQAVADDLLIKTVFDHMKNLAVCAALTGAAVWKFERNTGAVDLGVVAILGSVTVALATLTHFNMLHKLQSMKTPPWVYAILTGVYAVVLVEMFRY